MPSITLILSDTPTGAVAIHSDFKPAIGAPCSPAQAAALDVISRTQRDWKMIALSGDVNAIPSDRRFHVVEDKS